MAAAVRPDRSSDNKARIWRDRASVHLLPKRRTKLRNTSFNRTAVMHAVCRSFHMWTSGCKQSLVGGVFRLPGAAFLRTLRRK